MKMTREEAIDLIIEAGTALGWLVVHEDTKKPTWVVLGSKESVAKVLSGECNGDLG